MRQTARICQASSGKNLDIHLYIETKNSENLSDKQN